MTKHHRPKTVLTLAAALVFALAGCDASSDTEAADGGPPVIAPGKPGEDAATLSAEEAAKALPDDSPNQADIRYVMMMIEHHRQAIVMTDLAEQHAGADPVRALADRIGAAQEPEIAVMEAWLTANGGSGHGGHAHDHDPMPGMATKEQLDELRAARGADFDQLFLELMIVHHEGAVAMATDVLSHGNNVKVEEMANDVIAQQSSEITRMRTMQ